MYTIPIIFRSVSSILPSATATKKLIMAKVEEPTPSETDNDWTIATKVINIDICKHNTKPNPDLYKVMGAQVHKMLYAVKYE
jgi:hypothetical protein